MNSDSIEQIWHGVGICAVIILIIALTLTIFAPKPVVRYYMGNGSRIYADVPWSPDLTVCGDGISVWEATRLVDSLNTELAKHPRPNTW